MFKILGVYNVENYKNVNLIEVESDDINLDFEKITQEVENQEELNWQAAYDEVLLNTDGTEIVSIFNQHNIRSIFFFHFLNITKPLITQFGPINLPQITEMPERLKKIIKYYPVD